MFSEDYLKFQNYLEAGNSIFINGYLKQRYNSGEYEFKVQSITLAETIKKILTRQVQIDLHPSVVDENFLSFFERNVKEHPGKSSLRFNLISPENQTRISLLTLSEGFEMNDEMAEFLENHPALSVQVLSN